MSAAPQPLNHPEWDRLQRNALLVALAGLVAFIVIGVILHVAHAVESPLQFFLSYLVAYNFWLGAALGCLALLMLQHLTGGAWGLVLRRIFESGTRTLWLLLVLFVPILIGIHFLYLWAQPEQLAADEDLRATSHWWLNVPFFIGRFLVYFAIWLFLSFLLNRWSREQDEHPTLDLPRRFRHLCGPGLVLYGVTITFAAVDWVMSLEPHWYSTIYPPLFAIGQVLTGMALAIAVLLLLLSTQPQMDELLAPDVMRDIGNLLLALVMIWAYLSFSQYLLIWVGNLPEEIVWPLRRTRAGWQAIVIALIVFHFALPFLLLLSRDMKERGPRLAAIAIGILVLRFVDLFWWIEPAYTHEGQYVFWLLDVAALACVGGVWVWWFLRQLRQRPLLPLHDPYLAEMRSHD